MPLPERGQWLLATPFLALGLWCLLGWARVSELHCARQSGETARCVLISESLLQQTLDEFDGDLLRTAQIEVHTTYDENQVQYVTRRVVLILANGPRALSSFGAGHSDELLQDISEFVANADEPELHLRADSRWFAYPMGGLWLLFAGWILWPEGLRWPRFGARPGKLR